MTQAIGRARRYGQTKPVHIYHFLALKTIDVDTMQLCTGKLLTDMKKADAPEFIPFSNFRPSSFRLVENEQQQMGEWGSGETSRLMFDLEEE
jgi:hypothetical protein